MQLDPQLLSQKKKMQVDIIMKESDIRKMERNKALVETELRDLKHKINLLEAEVATKESSLKKIESEHAVLYNEIVKLKHKMNTLGHDNV